MAGTIWFCAGGGFFGVAGENDSVTRVEFADSCPGLTPESEWTVPQKLAADQILEFLGGKRRELTFPAEETGTAFQKSVWAALREIPYGQTRSYGEIAAQLGSPGAARAVGAACGRNPLLLFTPCHRVVGAGGGLTGFRGGLPLKRLLLSLESGR